MILQEIKNIKSSESDLKRFGITMGITLIVIAVILIIGKSYYYPYSAIAGLALIVFAYMFPVVLKPFQKAWMGLAVLMGWISTRLILSVLYYLVITPIALIARAAGKKFLDTKIDRQRVSYWNYRAIKNYDPAGSEKQF
ncbi:MAG: hypothetical protein HF312_14210 [Ignavibacteria bacterium]|jgi:hypothetical protein|nr:hypothetical protein [Ignavibacteria bacterium]MCU7521371.1 hypothetical protein [Ignavibacteria bacterium]HEX2963882.1 SxtJ family membrane protein [Ignavibacteriales bacterium]